MTSSTRRTGDHAQPIRGPGELVQAIPYLIGYHPHESAVLVGLRSGRLVVTARLDLADVRPGDGPDDVPTAPLLEHTVNRAVDGGASEFVVVVYTDATDGVALPAVGVTDRGMVPRAGVEVARAAAAAVAHDGHRLLDALLVRSGRCWSYLSTGPLAGWDLDVSPSPFVAEATVAGVAPRPDRAAVAASLDPCPDEVRDQLGTSLAEAENTAMAAVLDGSAARHDRAARRAVLAAVRACHQPGWAPPAGDELAALAVALTNPEIRDEVWLVIEARSVDGRPLMLELGRRCPSPYDAAPLFLYGWACWRAGNSMLAGEAARRALAADARCSAAQLLLDAVENGVDPHRLPALRRPRWPR